MNILDTIVNRTKERIEEEKKEVPLSEIRARAEVTGAVENAEGVPAFEQALRAEGLSFICEVKRAISESKGLIAKEFLIWRSRRITKKRVRPRFPA